MKLGDTNMWAGVHLCHFLFQAHSKIETRKHSLLILDGVIAGVTHADLELEAHDGVA